VTSVPAPFDAVVLAGGRGRRLGGVDKAEVLVAGRALLDRALDAAAGARWTVVVGPQELERAGVSTVLEEPPGSGPAAGLWAGVAALDRRSPGDAAAVLVLACDVPLAVRAVPGLLAALAGDPAADGAHLVDGTGRVQPLVAVYRHAPLRAALDRLPDQGRGCSMRQLVAGLALTRVVDVDGNGADADTWDDVARLEARIRGGDMDLDRTRDTSTPDTGDRPQGTGTR
jgi:molybdopterin-guanine dinucleotide biosynthesis protein A